MWNPRWDVSWNSQNVADSKHNETSKHQTGDWAVEKELRVPASHLELHAHGQAVGGNKWCLPDHPIGEHSTWRQDGKGTNKGMNKAPE